MKFLHSKNVLKLLLLPLAFSVCQDVPIAVTKPSNEGMVVTSSSIATEVGIKIIKDGGTAVDALVAVQSVLGLIDPGSSGLGGGSFAVYYDSKTKKIKTFDGREKAPSSATEDRFASTPLGFIGNWQSGLSVGVPGTPLLLEVMHEQYGHKDWSELFEDAIRIAEDGFEMGQRQADLVSRLLAFNANVGRSCSDRLIFRDPAAFTYLADPDSCTSKPAETILTNADYAETLRAIRDHGAQVFYNGPIAEAIVAAVSGDLNIPGDMTVDDLANYDVVERDPACMNYRKQYKVCGMGPPSSGGIAVSQMLGILDNFELTGSPLDLQNVHLFTQAGRLAFADRNKYVADSDFVTVPVEGLLDKDYIASRAAHVGMVDMLAEAGIPPGKFDSSGPDERAKSTGTTHISIVDSYGNAVSVTSSIEAPFGNGVLIKGFFLNNELTDFSAASATEDGTPIANRVQGNKRPRSSMSPTIVLNKQGDLELVTGSPGGSLIIGYTAQSIMNVIDFGLDSQQAINVPHYQNRNDYTVLEAPSPGITVDFDVEKVKLQLERIGHDVTIVDSSASGLGVIQVKKKENEGGKKDSEKSKKQNKSSKRNKSSKQGKSSKDEKSGKQSKRSKDEKAAMQYSNLFLVCGADLRRNGLCA